MTLADLRGRARHVSPSSIVANGFPVARAYVPAQSIDRGGVEIAVLEGRYGKLDVRNESDCPESLVRDTLRTPATDSVIETAPLDRDLLLLRDLAGVAVSATLTPGERVGTADLIVDVTADADVQRHARSRQLRQPLHRRRSLWRQRCRGEPRGTRRSADRARTDLAGQRPLVRPRGVSDAVVRQRAARRRRGVAYLLFARREVQRARCRRRREHLHAVHSVSAGAIDARDRSTCSSRTTTSISKTRSIRRTR